MPLSQRRSGRLPAPSGQALSHQAAHSVSAEVVVNEARRRRAAEQRMRLVPTRVANEAVATTNGHREAGALAALVAAEESDSGELKPVRRSG
jgi:hypothetical protein